MAECHDWVPAEEHGVQAGAVYELRWAREGTLGSVDPAAFDFVISGRPEVTLIESRNVGLTGFGDPTARVLVRNSGPARQALAGLETLQVASFVGGDQVLRLSELRLCPVPEIDPLEVEVQEQERREEIENMEGPQNPLGRFLEPLQDVSQGAALIAGLVLLALLWPLLRDLWRGIVRGGTLLWD